MQRAVSWMLLSLVLLVPLGASAVAPLGGMEPLSITITPQFPKPFETITIRPASSIVNLSASTVTVYVNGAVIDEGSGSRAVSAAVGGPGTKTTVRVTAVSGGQTYEKQVVLTPADVALIQEPASTVPLFYKGAALVAPEARVRLIAIPDIRTSSGTRIASQDLVYTWRLGERILEADSGIGRNVLSATAPVRHRNADVSVTVTNKEGTITARQAVVVAPVQPLVLLYRNSPLFGIDLTKIVRDTFNMTTGEETFRAEPYYFASAPSFTWLLNSTPSGTAPDLTVRTTGSDSGSATLEVNAQQGPAQSAATSIVVRFNAANSNNLFGL